MKLQIDAHTLERAAERGVNESEIMDVIETGIIIDAKYGESEKRRSSNLTESVMVGCMTKRESRYSI